MKKAYLFDLDGTLLDTLRDLAESVNYILDKYGYPRHTTEQIRQMLGNGARNLMRLALPPETEEAQLEICLADYKDYYEQHCQDHSCPFPGIEELLSALRQRGAQVAILSNKPDGATKRLCAEYFPGIHAQGQTETVRRKPAPDGVLAILKELKVSREDAVYIGDSEVDLETARNCEMDSIIVTWGFRDREQLLRSGAKCLVDRPEEILEVI